MKANYEVRIMLNQKRSAHQKNTTQMLQWLKQMMPSISKKQRLITDDMFLAPLGHAVSFCLS